MRVLVVNAGSSSLKLSLLDGDTLASAQTLPLTDSQVDLAAVSDFVDNAGPVDAVGHRVVHGGTTYIEPVVIDDDVTRHLEELVDLAPLHQPKSLHALRIAHALLPDTPAVACFDTAFHASIPEPAATYALPARWRRRWPLRRFGFHGLSHAYAARRATQLIGVGTPALRIVTCHLGAGASLAAVHDGVSVDTTMGFTPLEGLMMATRSGTVDPGLLLWLQQHAELSVAEIATALEHESGLVGVAGNPDMRTVLAAEAAGSADAHLAVEVYLHRLRGGIATMAAAMDGLDVLVFTGGVGERAAPIRERAVDRLSHLRIRIDTEANSRAQPDVDVSADGSAVRVLVLTAGEDLEISRHVHALVG